jgi:hypothetical protein
MSIPLKPNNSSYFGQGIAGNKGDWSPGKWLDMMISLNAGF